jgi:anti-anti-sigma regulatory factor
MILMSKWGSMLTERDLGELVRVAIENELECCGKVVIDMSGVVMVNSSFADEAFGKLVSKLGLEKAKKQISFINTNETIKTIINNAISTRLTLSSLPA